MEIYISIIDFAARMRLHPNTIRKLIKTGRLQFINFGSGKKKTYRIPESEIQRLALFDLREVTKNLCDID